MDAGRSPDRGTMNSSLRRRLRDVVGADGWIGDADTLEAYGRDATEDLAFPPTAAVRPRTTDEVAALLRLAHDAGLPVTPRGAGTGLSGGALPVRGGLVLSLERMDRILGLDSDDGLLAVEAGVTTARVRAEAADGGLLYPPDPGSSETCQIGGNVAEDAAGPRSFKYGTTRRWVAALQAVRADGSVVETGGPPTKNASGYDLTQLLVGSEGTLAVVTRVLLRLTRRPELTWTAGTIFPDVHRASAAVVSLATLRGDLSACELLDATSLTLVARVHILPEGFAEAGAAVLLRLDAASEEGALGIAHRCQAIVSRHGGGELLVACEAAEQRRLWQARAAVGEAVKRHSPYKEVDAVVPVSRVGELADAAAEAARQTGLRAACYGHAGDGNLHVNLLRDDLADDDWATRRDRAEDRILDRVLALGGAVTGEHGIGWVQRRHLPRAHTAQTLRAMADVKRAWDPRGILNPDKAIAEAGTGDRSPATPPSPWPD